MNICPRTVERGLSRLLAERKRRGAARRRRSTKTSALRPARSREPFNRTESTLCKCMFDRTAPQSGSCPVRLRKALIRCGNFLDERPGTDSFRRARVIEEFISGHRWVSAMVVIRCRSIPLRVLLGTASKALDEFTPST